MAIEDLIEQGDFEGALALLRQEIAGPQPDPEQLLTTFKLEVRLQRFDAADATMRRLIQLHPQVAEPMGALARTARAEAAATARLVDPAAAGRRGALGVPPPYALAYVKAAVLHAQKDYAGAKAAIAEAKAQTPPTAGTMTWRNGRTARFTDITDSDDLTGANLPCYDGDKVLDLPYSQIKSVAFLDPRISFDVMWIPVELASADGKAFRLRVPAYYAGSGVAEEAHVRTGQMTMWKHDHGYAEGLGQRDFKLSTADGGLSIVGVLQVRRIDFEVKAAAEPEKPKGFWNKLFG
jgi:protein involved in temperature-dependent protein secretion